MKKRLVALGMAVLLVLSLVSCADESKEKDPIQEFLDSRKMENETFTAFDKDAEDMKDPLVICMDLEYVRDPNIEVDVILNDFLYTLEESGGLTDVEILYLPKHGTDRESRMDRIRVEIMAGEGPDVFIMNCSGLRNDILAIESDPLIAFPEQAMENGLFLPLDEYMENNTRFAEWDKFTKPIMDVGRNEEGQQIIPLSYTLPILCFRKSDVDLDLTNAAYTWEDMLHDPELSPYGRLLADCATPGWDDEYGFTLSMDGMCYMEYALGKHADFDEEELCFTEEELLQRVQEVMQLHEELDTASKTMKEGTKGDLNYSSTWLGWEMVSGISDIEDNIPHEDPLTMVPLYSDDGGVTASILSWAAVNRNTDKPEEAYIVIDMLMRDYVQTNYWIYEEFLCTPFQGIPMHEGVLHPDMPFGRGAHWSLTEENYNEWCELRSQITGANFQSEIGVELKNLLDQCIFGSWGIYGYEDFTTVEESVHEAYEKMQRMVRE